MSDKIEVSRDLLERLVTGMWYADSRKGLAMELETLLGPVRYQVLFPARGGMPAGYRICTKDVAGQWFREGLPMLTPDPSRVKELDYPTTLNRMGNVKL